MAPTVLRESSTSRLALLGLAYQRDEADEDNTQLSNEFDVDGIEPDQADIAGGNESREVSGIYAQDVWNLGNNITLTGGVRYDRLTDFDDEISSRVAVTGHYPNGWYFKTLAGTAYRVPSYREYLDIVSYNVDLEPEHMRTIELQLGRKFSKGDINVTAYLNDYEDFIKDLSVQSITEQDGQVRIIEDEYAINAKEREITGLEVVSTYYPTERLKLSANFDVILEATETIGFVDDRITLEEPVDTSKVDLDYLTDWSVRLSAAYHFQNINVGIDLTQYSNRDVPAGYQSSIDADVQDKSNADGWSKLDLYVSYDLTSIDLQLYAKFYNLLDEEYFSPPFGSDSRYDSEMPGTNVRCGLRLTF